MLSSVEKLQAELGFLLENTNLEKKNNQKKGVWRKNKVKEDQLNTQGVNNFLRTSTE